MNESKKNIWMTVLSGCALYTIGIFGTLHVFFNAFSLPNQLSIYFITFIFSVFFLILQSVFSAKKQFITILSVLGIWILLGLFFRDALLDGAISLGHYFVEDIPKVVNYEIIPPPRPTSASELECTQFVAYILFPFTGLLSWAVVVRKSVFFSILLTVPFFAAVFFLRGLPSDISVALLLSFWFIVLIRNRNIRRLNRVNARITIAGFFVFLILIFSFMKIFPRDTYVPANKAFELRDEITTYLMNLERSNPIDGIPGFTSGSPLAGSDTQVNLNAAGNMRFTERDVFRVYSSQPRDMYLRGYAAALYENNAWKQLPNGVFEENRFLMNPLTYLAGTNYFFTDNTPVEIRIDQFEMDSDFIFTPYLLAGVTSDPAIQFYRDSYITTRKKVQTYTAASYLDMEDAIAISPSNSNFFKFRDMFLQNNSLPERMIELDYNGNQLTYFYNPVLGPSFIGGDPELDESVKNYFNNPPAELNIIDLFYPANSPDKEYLDFLLEEYTKIPDPLRRNLLIWWGTDEENIPFWKWAETAKSVAERVQNSGSYTLTPGTQPMNRDFVEYFLFERNQGYCVHFASATVAVLRALGIPARYAEGYVVSKSEFNVGGFATIPANNAHAWAEIWIPDLGWIPVESTPGGAPPIAAAQAEQEALLAELEEELRQQETAETTEMTSPPESTASPSDPSPTQSASPSAPAENGAQSNKNNEALQRALLFVALFIFGCGVICFAIFITRHLYIKSRKSKFQDENYEAAVLYAYKYLEKLTRFGTVISDEATQIALKARFSDHSIEEAEKDYLLSECETSRIEAQRFLNRWEKSKFWFRIL